MCYVPQTLALYCIMLYFLFILFSSKHISNFSFSFLSIKRFVIIETFTPLHVPNSVSREFWTDNLAFVIPYAFMLLSETIQAGLLVLVTQCVTGSTPLHHSLQLPYHLVQLWLFFMLLLFDEIKWNCQK